MRCSKMVPSFVLATLLLSGDVFAQPAAEWSVSTSNVTMSSPRFADINGDATRDVILATMGPIGDPFSAGSVHVYNAAGDVLPGWPIALSQPISSATVAVGDIDDNGDQEIVAQGWFFTYVWNHDGTAFPGWPKATGTTFSSGPLLIDADGDGDLEIVVPDEAVMHMWHHDGTEAAGWPNNAEETFNAASAADIDGDGDIEIVAGTWRPQFPDTVPFTLNAWELDGTAVSGFPILNLGSVRGPVSLGDIDDDGQIEIVTRAGDTLHVFDGQGNEEPGWPIEFGDPIRNATPTLGDLDGDGDLEILIAGFDMNALHHDGAIVTGFPVDIGATFNVNSGAIIASIDDDPANPEIIVKIANSIVALAADGSSVAGFPLPFSDDGQSGTFSPSPVVGDVDGDGDVEYAFASSSGTLAFFDEAEPYAPGVAYWPAFQHDVRNTSFLSLCPWDLDGSGDVGINDLLDLLAAWGTDPGGPPDFDGDGDVGINDLLEVLASWGPC